MADAASTGTARAAVLVEEEETMVGSVGHILHSTFADLYGGSPPPGSKPVARAVAKASESRVGEDDIPEDAAAELAAIDADIERVKASTKAFEAGLEEAANLALEQDDRLRAEARSRGLVLGSEVPVKRGLLGLAPQQLAANAGMGQAHVISAADVVDQEERERRIRTGNLRAGRTAPDFFSSAAAAGADSNDGEGPGYLRSTAAASRRMDASKRRFLGTTGSFGTEAGIKGEAGGVKPKVGRSSKPVSVSTTHHVRAGQRGGEAEETGEGGRKVRFGETTASDGAVLGATGHNRGTSRPEGKESGTTHQAEDEEEAFDRQLKRTLPASVSVRNGKEPGKGTRKSQSKRVQRLSIQEEAENTAAKDRMTRPLQYLRNPRYLKGHGLRAQVRQKQLEAQQAAGLASAPGPEAGLGSSFAAGSSLAARAHGRAGGLAGSSSSNRTAATGREASEAGAEEEEEEFTTLGAGEGGLGWAGAVSVATTLATAEELAEAVDGELLDAGRPLRLAQSVNFHGGAAVDKDAVRLAKKHTLRGIRAAPVVESGSAARVGPFLAKPPIARFEGYEPGQVLVMTIALQNADSLSRSLRVLPPATDHFSSEPPVYASGAAQGAVATGALAPGMAVTVRVCFTPDSFADCRDSLIVLTESGKFAIPLVGINPHCRMDLPLDMDAGLCLSSDITTQVVTVTNTGAAGAFRLFPADAWPPACGTDAVTAATLVAADAGEDAPSAVEAARSGLSHNLGKLSCAYGPSPKALVSPPFTVSPAFFRIGAGGTARLRIRFSPPVPGTYERRFFLLSQTGDVTEHTLTGKCAHLAAGLTAIDGTLLPAPALSPAALQERLQRRRDARGERISRVHRAEAARLGDAATSQPSSPLRSPDVSVGGWSRPVSAASSKRAGAPTGAKPAAAAAAGIPAAAPPDDELREALRAMVAAAPGVNVPRGGAAPVSTDSAAEPAPLPSRGIDSQFTVHGLVNPPERLRFDQHLVGHVARRTVSITNDTPISLPFRWVVRRFVPTPPTVDLFDPPVLPEEGKDGAASPSSSGAIAGGPVTRAVGGGLAAAGALLRRPSKADLVVHAAGVGAGGDIGAAGLEARRVRFKSVSEAAEHLNYSSIAEAQFTAAVEAEALAEQQGRVDAQGSAADERPGAGRAAGANRLRGALVAAAGTDDPLATPFTIEPASGRLPASGTMTFSVCFRPDKPIPSEAVAKLLVEGVPVSVDEHRDPMAPLPNQGGLRLPGDDSDRTLDELLAALSDTNALARAETATILRKRVTVSTVFLHSAGRAPDVVLTPSVAVFPEGNVLPGSSATQAVTIKNASGARLWFEFGRVVCMQRLPHSREGSGWVVVPNQALPHAWHDRALAAAEGRRIGDADGSENAEAERARDEQRHIFSVSPSAGEIGAFGVASIVVSLDAVDCGDIACEVPCKVYFAPVATVSRGSTASAGEEAGLRPAGAMLAATLRLRSTAHVTAPFVRFTVPEVDFGLMKVATSETRVVTVQNQSGIAAPWILEQTSPSLFLNPQALALRPKNPADCCLLSFSPASGVLPPFGEARVAVSCTAGQHSQRLREMVQCSVPAGGSTVTIRVRGEVQSPLVFVDRHSISLGIAFVGVPVRRTVRVTNLSNLKAEFRWDAAVGMVMASAAEAEMVASRKAARDREQALRTLTGTPELESHRLAQEQHAIAAHDAMRAMEKLRADNEALGRPRSRPSTGDGIASGGAASASPPLTSATAPPLAPGIKKPIAPYDVTIEPEVQGLLGEKETREFTFEITPRTAIGSLDSLCALDVVGVDDPVGFALEGIVRPLTVSYAAIDPAGKPNLDPAFEAACDRLRALLDDKGQLPDVAEIPADAAMAAPHVGFSATLRMQSEAVKGDPGAAGDETMMLLRHCLERAEAAGARVGRMPVLDFGERHATFTRQTFEVEVHNLSGVPTDFAVRVRKYPAYAGSLSAGPAGLELEPERAKALAAQDPSGVALRQWQQFARGVAPAAEGAGTGSAHAGRRDRGFLGLPFADEIERRAGPGRAGSRAASSRGARAPPGAPASSRPKQWLGREHEDRARFQSSAGQAELRRRRALEIQREQLGLLNGVAFQVWPRTCHLTPFATARVLVSCVADMPGKYEDELEMLMDGTAPCRLPLKVTVVGSPLSVDPTTAGMRSNVFPPALSFGDLPAGGGTSSKLITVRNTAPLDAHIRWSLTIPRAPHSHEPAIRLSIGGGGDRFSPASDAASKLALWHYSGRQPAALPPFSVEPAEAVVPAQSSTTFRVTATPRNRNEADVQADAEFGWDAAEAQDPRRGLLIADALWVPKGSIPPAPLAARLRDPEADDVLSTDAGEVGDAASTAADTVAARPGTAAATVARAAEATKPQLTRESLRLGLLVNPVMPRLQIDEEPSEEGIPWLGFDVWATRKKDHHSYFREVTLTNSFDLSVRFGVEVEGPFVLERVHTAVKPAPGAGSDLTETYKQLEARGVRTISLPPRSNVVLLVRFVPALVLRAAEAAKAATTGTAVGDSRADLAATGREGTGRPTLAGTAVISKAAVQAGAPPAAGALREEYCGEVKVTYVSGDVQRIGLRAEVLRPKVIATPAVSNFGLVQCGKPRVHRLLISNPTAVEAEWALRHVPWPKPKAKVVVDLGALGLNTAEGLQSLAEEQAALPEVIDDPTAFGFSKHTGALPGPTVDLEVAPRAAALREAGATGQPANLGVRFAPMAPGVYRSRFRVEVRGGQPFEVVLVGRGTHEE